MFLLPRILFNVCWWARFDTLASWVDWFPLHTRPLFVMCLVAFAIVFCLAPLHLSHWGPATHLKSGAHTHTHKKNNNNNKHVSYYISRTMGDCYTLRAESTLNDFRSVTEGGLAQMVERPLSMREVPESIPGFSNHRMVLAK